MPDCSAEQQVLYQAQTEVAEANNVLSQAQAAYDQNQAAITTFTNALTAAQGLTAGLVAALTAAVAAKLAKEAALETAQDAYNACMQS